MHQKIIAILILSLFLVLSIVTRNLYFPVLHGYSAYYFHSIFWICGLLVSILILNLVWHLFFARNYKIKTKSIAQHINRRNSFRIIYPDFIRPTIFIEKADSNPKRQLEFPIMDLSQGGSCFLDDGSLGLIKHFTGCIQFENGKRLRVSGKLIRKNGNQVSIKFDEPIAWSTLLDEQRHVISKMRPYR